MRDEVFSVKPNQARERYAKTDDRKNPLFENNDQTDEFYANGTVPRSVRSTSYSCARKWPRPIKKQQIWSPQDDFKIESVFESL